MDPTGFCTALTRYATRKGAKVIENCPVMGIQVEPTLFGGEKIKAVTTTQGEIKTSNVVNAAGMYEERYLKRQKILYLMFLWALGGGLKKIGFLIFQTSPLSLTFSY